MLQRTMEMKNKGRPGVNVRMPGGPRLARVTDAAISDFTWKTETLGDATDVFLRAVSQTVKRNPIL